MKWSFTLRPILFTLLCIAALSNVRAQTSCEYTLVMEDSFGDGWNGCALNITIGGTTTTYALDNINDDGQSLTVGIPVTDGDGITLEFIEGAFIFEVSYTLIDAEFNVVFEDGLAGGAPATGVVFEGTASCPSCPPPITSAVDIENIRAFRADLSWIPSDPAGETIIEYGPAGFVLGEGTNLMAGGAMTTLLNLEENTAYEVYLLAACSNGDTSLAIGPYTFATPYANDVGVADILSPTTDCNLGFIDSISLMISNYGGAPQSLIPFNFSVNGIPGGVNMPTDGVYAGVIGTDSTEFAEFDAGYDLSEPGEYLFEIWTDLLNDSVRTNDTTRLLVVSIPEVTEFPYYDTYEEWGGGWTVEQSGNGLPSWEYGMPAGTIINSAVSGNNAWVTNLGGAYNNSEISYLVSPCLDFSSLNEDPRIAFFMNFDSESCCDEAWVELSVDGGETWEKVGAAETGVNWYNDAGNQWWDGTAGFEGWSYVQNILTGAAGQAEARVRFVFSSDGSVVREGIGLDNMLIGPTLDDDMAASALANNSLNPCGDSTDLVTFTVRNVGDAPQQNIGVAYQVNGGPVVMETTGDEIIFPGAEFEYTFNQSFNSSTPGLYVVRAWSMLDGDGFIANDTTTFVYRTAFDLPYREDFEAGGIPDGWATSTNVAVSNGHNNSSFAIHANLWSFSNTMSIELPVLGPVQANDTLRFDYRFVDYFAGTNPTAITEADSLVAEISLDCGLTYEPVLAISVDNHTPAVEMTTVEIPLADSLAGEYMRLRLRGVWGAGDYWLDIDNINVRRCGSLELDADITGATGENNADGVVEILTGAGEGPYTFEWTSGDSTRVVNTLLPGQYLVTVTDGYGCQDLIAVTVDIEVSTADLDQIGQVRLSPNPTTDLANLEIAFHRPTDARIQVINTMGQLMAERLVDQAYQETYQLDLSNYDSGMYFVRIFAEGQVKTLKLIKAGGY